MPKKYSKKYLYISNNDEFRKLNCDFQKKREIEKIIIELENGRFQKRSKTLTEAFN